MKRCFKNPSAACEIVGMSGHIFSGTHTRSVFLLLWLTMFCVKVIQSRPIFDGSNFYKRLCSLYCSGSWFGHVFLMRGAEGFFRSFVCKCRCCSFCVPPWFWTRGRVYPGTRPLQGRCTVLWVRVPLPSGTSPCQGVCFWVHSLFHGSWRKAYPPRKVYASYIHPGVAELVYPPWEGVSLNPDSGRVSG